MSLLLPPQLLPVAGALALVIIWPRLDRQTTAPRLLVETLAITAAMILVTAALWAALWWVEQGW